VKIGDSSRRRKLGFGVSTLFGVVVLCAGTSAAQLVPDLSPAEEELLEEIEEGDASVDEVGRQLANPVGAIWNLTVQNNFSLLEGDISDARRGQWVTNVQPVLPVPLTESWNLITRPIIPIVDAPVPKPSGFDRETGLGDMALFGLLSPADPRGFIWGVGPTFLFPTATEDELGSEKWSAGPALVGLVLGEKWLYGGLVQQWWSYAGDDDRRSVSLMNFQPFLIRFLPNGWQVGSSPIIAANWKADGSDVWTVPLALTASKTLRLGPLPFQVGFEAGYNVVRPDTFGPEWTFRLTFKPVIPGLVQEPLFGGHAAGSASP
jgi:hypothetical protein